ncbi:MAG: 16S rRNA (guanine(527)-N(7))-methyltransferase RsmG [bacterium]|nr:16S rRNA (guanine(527)-N(7))-methyltransferase RsmG [bacterium]
MFSEEETQFFLDGLPEEISKNLDKEKILKFSILVDHLIESNKKFNLTAITDRKEVIEKHLIDSLLIQHCSSKDGWRRVFTSGPSISDAARGDARRQDPSSERRFCLDIGTGAGFPALPLAILNPTIEFTLVDATQKKIVYLKETIILLGLKNCKTIWAHLPDKKVNGQFSEIVSRGTFKIREFLKAALPHLSKTGRLLIMKGKEPTEELGQAKQITVKNGLKETIIRYKLPYSKADRSLIIFDR